MCPATQTVGSPRKWAYFFGEGNCEGDPERKDVLGGKGASLGAMSKAGLPVPPGFTICVDCCSAYLESGTWPEGLEDQVRENLAKLENVTGRKFGKGREPLLVSVRSGAARSMPGMMDTILNCGLHPELEEVIPDKEQFWHVYSQFVLGFAKTVADIPEAEFEKIAEGVSDGPDRGKRLAGAYKALYKERSGKDFPSTPWDELVECIEAVFRSWNSDRAIVYRKHNDIRGLNGTAVNVQAMFPSQKSGIGFTANPTNPDGNEIILESSYGLGESIVSGNVTPDRFVLDKDTLELKEEAIGNKEFVIAAIGDTSDHDPAARSLTDEQVAELGRIAIQVEEYFGFPVDFEWGWADGRFGLLQSRAVRGLEIAQDMEVGRQEEIKRLKEIAGDGRKVWVVHNLSETLEAPTPLTWGIIKDWMRGDGGFGLMYQDLGYGPSARVREKGFLDLILGRIYADPDRAARLFWDEGLPFEYNLDEIAEDPNLLEAAPTTFDANKADGGFLLRIPKLLLSLLRSSRRTNKARPNALADFKKELEPYLEYLNEERSKDLSAMSIQEVIDVLNKRRSRIMDDFGKESLKPGFFGGLARSALEESFIILMGEQQGKQLCAVLTSGLEGDTTVEQNVMLYEVAHGRARIDNFLESYGHRTVGEMDLSNPRWREDSSYVEQILDVYRKPASKSPEELHKTNQERRDEVERELPEKLAEWGGSSQLEEFQDLIKETQELLPYRETGKHYLMMGYELIRNTIVELSRRWNLGRDIFFLHLDELARFESERDAMLSEIEKRKIRWQSAHRLDHPRVVDSNEIDKLGLPREIESADEYKADPLAAGVYTGTAHVVFDPKEAGEIGADCILVCPSTDPGWTALFATIKALVVERGGALSHGAITARDFGIPAVACPDATKKFPEGTKIRVDGNQGTIAVLEE